MASSGAAVTPSRSPNVASMSLLTATRCVHAGLSSTRPCLPATQSYLPTAREPIHTPPCECSPALSLHTTLQVFCDSPPPDTTVRVFSRQLPHHPASVLNWSTHPHTHTPPCNCSETLHPHTTVQVFSLGASPGHSDTVLHSRSHTPPCECSLTGPFHATPTLPPSASVSHHLLPHHPHTTLQVFLSSREDLSPPSPATREKRD